MKSVEELLQQEKPKLLACVHCGLCLDVCPTYQLSGNEINSPRGRVATWRAIDEGRIDISPETDFYTEECVGCLACMTACPAKVPYGDLLAENRARRVSQGMPVDWKVRIAGNLVPYTGLFQFLNLPLRMLRRLGLPLHKFMFQGKPPVFQSTASYARQLMERHRPGGPKVALLTGCLMEAAFREINFATVRALIANNVQVLVPQGQVCCGAVHEHAGLAGKEELDEQNSEAFDSLGVDAVVTNSAGCGLALRHALKKTQQRDVLGFLNELPLKPGASVDTQHIYHDMPCHLYHGQQVQTPPEKVFEAIGNSWSLAPDAERCCGSGGTYNITHAENSQQILRDKSAFLNEAPHDHCTLSTANHVCMMQWNSAMATGMVKKKVDVRHVIQLLDESYQRAGLYD